MDNNFFKQIKEDIEKYQEDFKNIRNIKKDEWAFNYWVLDKLFYEEEELIEEKIIEYNDMGIDAYEFYEDTKELFLIQNKYYTDKTKLNINYVKNDFLLRGITALENGTYNRSEELQNIFDKYKNDPEFTVYLELYVTNDLVSVEIEEYIKKFNKRNSKYISKVYYLKDIKEKYYGESEQNRKELKVQIKTVNKGTALNINPEAYNLKNIINAKYVLTPVSNIFEIYKKSKNEGYPIFDKNIREYLGNNKINKKIYNTLMDEKDRNNFFYYNNGITIICDKIGTFKSLKDKNKLLQSIEIKNPQIVNGCQTVNSIYEALKNSNEMNVEEEYKNTFVMVKILEIDRNNFEEEELYNDIVKYNNSQNSINEKNFIANNEIFRRLQVEFEKKGFLLLIKQSDKESFKRKYKTISKLIDSNNQNIKKFKLKEIKKLNDLHINLEKLLQVINAFVESGYNAYTEKKNMLKLDKKEYNRAVDFIKQTTNDDILNLYLLYKKLEEVKKEDINGRIPILYYAIDSFAKFECDNRQINKIKENLDSSSKIEKIIKISRLVSSYYIEEYKEKYGLEYNAMIKKQIDYKILSKGRSRALELLEMQL
ncbi:AIPR family protein [Leptotrichia massiliensis]|uniref:AIPR family protein n=1 Tax=Leptotrichia massiliensis TaxID=1852388 RepID=UPI0008D97232|nr:AIPR family protein [Leptotrichia massiliensis]